MILLPLLITLVFLSIVRSEFTIVEDTCNSISVGVGAGKSKYGINVVSNTEGVMYVNVASQSSASSAPIWTQSKLTTTGMAFDNAINSMGASYYSGFGGIGYSNDTITYTTVEGLMGICQSVNYLADNENVVGMAGSFRLKGKAGFTYGIALVQDGITLDFFPVPVGESALRFAAFPSSQVFYASAGTWPTSSVSGENKTKFTKRISMNHEKGLGHVDMERRRKLQTETYTAQIYKSTDAGATWSMVYNAPSDADYYFNGISCADENTCVVVGEGDDSEGSPVAVVFTTNDSGATWVQTMNNNGSIYSLSSVKMINSKIGYIGGTTLDGRKVAGTVYYTEDGGMTWSVSETIKGCDIIMDIDFNLDGSVGFASCMSSSGAAGCVAEYIK